MTFPWNISIYLRLDDLDVDDHSMIEWRDKESQKNEKKKGRNSRKIKKIMTKEQDFSEINTDIKILLLEMAHFWFYHVMSRRRYWTALV